MLPSDPHSAFGEGSLLISSVRLDFTPDFGTRTLSGKGIYQLNCASGGRLSLDSRSIAIYSVKGQTAESLEWISRGSDAFRGDVVWIEVPEGTAQIQIEFSTAPDAPGLQWLPKEATEDKISPLLYTKAFPINCRSIFPIQDSPGIRFTYDVFFTHLPAHTSVICCGDISHRTGFSMTNPTPAFLFGFAIGAFQFKRLTPRSFVYAEPSLIESAARQCKILEDILTSAENLLGKYPWGQFNILFLPPSFPYLAMENPVCIFASRSLLLKESKASQNSNLSWVLVHELAHAWAGNLVTQASWDDLWLNEGWTTFFERKIVNMVFGEGFAGLIRTLKHQRLKKYIETVGESSQKSQIYYPKSGLDPEEEFSIVVLEKAADLLEIIEKKVGEDLFEKIAHSYLKSFAFGSSTTVDFIRLLVMQSQGKVSEGEMFDLLTRPGMLISPVKVDSVLVRDVDSAVEGWLAERTCPDGTNWHPIQKAMFLLNIQRLYTHAEIDIIFESLKIIDDDDIYVREGFLSLCALSNDYRRQVMFNDFAIKTGLGSVLIGLFKLIRSTNPDFAQELIQRYSRSYHSSVADRLQAEVSK